MTDVVGPTVHDRTVGDPLREAAGRVAARLDLEALTDEVIATFVDRPDFQSLRPPDAILHNLVRWNIDLVVRWSVEGIGPTSEELDCFRELARISAADGTTPDAVLSNFRRGARHAWQRILANSTEAEQIQLMTGADILFEFLDLVSGAFADGYEDATRLGGSSTEERACQTLLDRIADGEDLLASDRRLLGRIGMDLSMPFRPFVLGISGQPVNYYVGLAQQLRSRRALAVARGRQVSGISNVKPVWTDLDRRMPLLFAQGEVIGRQEITSSLEELTSLVTVAATYGLSGEVSLTDLLPETLLHYSPRVAQRLHASVYNTLPDGLVRTFNALVDHDFDRARTAAALPVHRNTLLHRISRIEVLTGLDLNSARGCAEAWLARRQADANARTARGIEPQTDRASWAIPLHT